MAAALYDCRGRSFCMLGAILENSRCDAAVVLTGLGDWVKGKQPSPWSNYFFTPDLEPEEELAPEVQEFYQDNPNLRRDMKQLEAMHEQLLKKSGCGRRGGGGASLAAAAANTTEGNKRKCRKINQRFPHGI